MELGEQLTHISLSGEQNGLPAGQMLVLWMMENPSDLVTFGFYLMSVKQSLLELYFMNERLAALT